MASNWPITGKDLKAALGETTSLSDTDAELVLFATAACERIDLDTGRNLEPTRHEIAGRVPAIFVLAARETAKLWWQQTKNGPRNRPQQGELDGPPAGADLPRKVQGWLGGYPPRLFIPTEDTP